MDLELRGRPRGAGGRVDRQSRSYCGPPRSRDAGCRAPHDVAAYPLEPGRPRPNATTRRGPPPAALSPGRGFRRKVRPMGDILERITAYKLREVAAAEAERPLA